MSRLSPRVIPSVLIATLVATLGAVVPARAHHSFSAYDMSVTKVFTGVVTRVNPDANHLQIFFAPMDDTRRNVLRDAQGMPVIWAVEMGGSAQMAREGVTVNSFPPGTVFSVGLHPLRDGLPAGTRGPTGAMYRCPPRTPPPALMNCDVVSGSVAFGMGGLLKPTG